MVDAQVASNGALGPSSDSLMDRHLADSPGPSFDSLFDRALRRSTTLSSKLNLPHMINFRAYVVQIWSRTPPQNPGEKPDSPGPSSNSLLDRPLTVSWTVLFQVKMVDAQVASNGALAEVQVLLLLLLYNSRA